MTSLIEDRSKELLEKLTTGLDFSIPNVDFDDKAFKIPDSLLDALQKVPEPLTIGLLTERKIDGDGAFDAVMTALKSHLKLEYDEGRITGAEYSKAYIAMLQSALQFAVQYLISRDNAYYQALGAQTQALISSINVYKAKVELAIAQAQAHQNKAEYANRVLGLGAVEKQTLLTNAQTSKTTEEVKLVTSQTARTEQDTKLTEANTSKVGKESLLVEAQTSQTAENTKLVTANTGKVGKEALLIEAQTTQTEENTKLVTANIAKTGEETRLVGTQILVQTQQKELLKEQTEAAHSQTSDTKLDKSPVSGSIGKQTALIQAQTEVQKQQKELLVEQTEQAHAQVSDKQLDGVTPVTGYTGNQNALLKQQVTSFKKDAIIKAAKVYADSLTTQLSMNTATVAGTGLDAAGIGKAIGKLASSMDGQ